MHVAIKTVSNLFIHCLATLHELAKIHYKLWNWGKQCIHITDIYNVTNYIQIYLMENLNKTNIISLAKNTSVTLLCIMGIIRIIHNL